MNTNNVTDSLATDGFIQFPHVLPLQSFFTRLYVCFDAFCQLMSEAPDLAAHIEELSDRWQQQGDNAAYYCNVPLRLTDRRSRDDKADKVYFQTCPEYSRFLRSELVCSKMHLRVIDRLLEFFDDLTSYSLRLFLPVIDRLDEMHVGLKGRLLPNDPRLPLVIRLLRYEAGEGLATSPHVDKSAFSLHINASDESQDRFVIGRWTNGLVNVDELRPVSRTDMSAVMFNGLCLAEAGYETLPPSPHAVLPVHGMDRRHAIVAFWLVPWLATDHLVTDLPYQDHHKPKR